MARKRKYLTLQDIMRDWTLRMKREAADALNNAAEEVIRQVRTNMNEQGIHEISHNLANSIQYDKATPDRLKVLVKSEAVTEGPKNPGKINPAMKGRYPEGKAVYGRLIEFSPRIGRPFFYTAWYKKRVKIRGEMVGLIARLWDEEAQEWKKRQ